jgi:uncharacterized repeat protein (TIGR01451 family)
MNKLRLYMRAVVVTALLVVGGLGVYKGRNLLSGQKTTPSSTGESAPSNDGANSSPDTLLQANQTPESNVVAAAPESKGSWFSGWFGSAKPKIMEGGKEIGPAAMNATESVQASQSAENGSSATSSTAAMMSKLKFGAAASQNNTDASGLPAPPASLTSAQPAGDTYAAAPTANEYAPNSVPAPALSGYGGGDGYGNAATTSSADSGAYGASPPPVAVAENNVANSTPIPNNLREYAPTTSPANETPSQNPGAQESVPAENTLPPENTLAVPNNTVSNNAYGVDANAQPLPDNTPAPVELPRQDTFAPAAPNRLADTAPVSALPTGPMNTAANGYTAANSNASSLNDYAPTRTPNVSPAAEPPSPLETALPATPITPSARYANEIPVASATASQAVDPQLQGPQTPSIVLEKFAPPEVQVGRAAMFEILVKNVGKVSAYDVQVVDEIPHGTRFQEANPQPSQTQGAKVLWKLGVMKPGDEKVIELRLVPESEGEIGSVAQVSFQAQVGAKSVVTRPKLEIRHQAPPQIHAGENATVALTISNTGSGAATGVYLESDIPAGFAHPAGPSLEYEVGTLRPGESKSIELVLRAEKAGQYQAPLVVRGEGDLQVQDVARIEVIAPSLQLQVQGPKKRFVERQSTHELTIANPGTAPAKNVEIIAQLPRGFKFISADHQGEYDARQHAVYWGLDELPPNSSGKVQVTTLPVEAGEQRILVEGQAGGGLTAQAEYVVAVDSVSELPFTVADLADPIEVNSETIYEVRVANRGGKEATNVRISAQFPNEVRPLEGDGATRATVAGQKVEFAPIGSIPPGSEAVVKISAQGLRAGDHRIAITVVSDEHPQPVTREEGTRVYLDQ